MFYFLYHKPGFVINAFYVCVYVLIREVVLCTFVLLDLTAAGHSDSKEQYESFVDKSMKLSHAIIVKY